MYLEVEDFLDLLTEDISTWIRNSDDPRVQDIKRQWIDLRNDRSKEAKYIRNSLRNQARALKDKIRPEKPVVSLGVQRHDAIKAQREAEQERREIIRQAKRELAIAKKGEAMLRKIQKDEMKLRKSNSTPVPKQSKVKTPKVKKSITKVKKAPSSTPVPKQSSGGIIPAKRPSTVQKFSPPPSKAPTSFKYTQGKPPVEAKAPKNYNTGSKGSAPASREDAKRNQLKEIQARIDMLVKQLATASKERAVLIRKQIAELRKRKAEISSR